MNIAVLIKQVPEIGEARINPETGTLDRSKVPLTINPLDLNAVELALRFQEEHGAKVSVFTLGPVSAERILRESLALGCDRAYLITGPEFAASDTLATSFALSRALERYAPWDLIVCGEKAIDGDTGQVGPGVASFLDIPVVTYGVGCDGLNQGRFRVRCLTERGMWEGTMLSPFLLTVTREINTPRFPTLQGKIQARTREIPRINAETLELSPDRVGLKGSPTWVTKVENVQLERQGRLLRDQSPQKLAEGLAGYLTEIGVLINDREP